MKWAMVQGSQLTGQEVRRMLVEVVAGPVIAPGRPRVTVSRCVLHIAQACSGVRDSLKTCGHGDEGVS
jgi:hypothetical protein